ncbi:MAG TPA: molybdopterin-synthase adenylyltransferase MoeB [Anaeromyxobacter sp.]|nr:molybdopterin-synthase adenylyltransferase MoeB [Anaeromyxobacter sp.]
MALSYADLLAQVKARIREVEPAAVRAALAAVPPPVLLDVREVDEWQSGHLPGAVHVPRGRLESRVEQLVPDRGAEVILYCAGGARSAFAAQTLAAMGYARVSSMSGGFGRWLDQGHPVVKPAPMRPEQHERYRRHLVIPEVGEEGQAKLLAARVLLIGVGGLGSPAALYLAAAGVGTLGIVDADVVDLSNLQRQVIHSTRTLGRPKVDSAAETLRTLNPDVKVVPYQLRLTRENALEVMRGFDVVVDGGDNFPTRYLVNDAAVILGVPVVHGSVYRFEGQVTTFWPGKGPCYRCLYPEPPPADAAPSCAEAGVLGVLPGVMGLLQANEVVKIVLGKGTPLTGRLLTYDALETRFQVLRLRRDPECPVCRPGAEPALAEDYESFCAAPTRG